MNSVSLPVAPASPVTPGEPAATAALSAQELGIESGRRTHHDNVGECAALGAIHSCSLGAPLLLEEAGEAGAALPRPDAGEATPFCDRMRQIGQWNTAWDPFYALDPTWTDQFFAVAVPAYSSGVLPAKEVELLSIAFDASYTHLYAPGVRRHIKGALAAGASVVEIMEVLKLCVVQGVQSCNMGAPILAEELERLSTAKA